MELPELSKAREKKSFFSSSLFLAMKLTVFLLLVASLHISAEGLSQKVTLSARNAAIGKLFKQISRQTGYFFLYDNAVLQQATPVNISLQNVPLQQALRMIFKDQPLEFTIMENNILVKVKPITAGSRPGNRKEEIPAGSIKEEKEISNTGDPLSTREIRRNERKARRFADTSFTVKGRLFDTHEPPGVLSSATISIKGSDKSVVSDADGYFSIEAGRNDVLVFSMVGYEPAEYIVLKNENSLNISLKEKVSSLNEVVVVGLSEQQKKHMASSIAQLNVSSNIAGKPVTTLSQSLQGGVTGLQVSQSSGLPGGDAAAIKIRGISTLGNSDPLILVDGVPMDMNHIDPVTVEGVTVLKDAAAAAIYGARAANGVILVTTKRGKPGKVSVRYDGYYGVQSPTSLPPTVDAGTYMKMYNEALINAGNSPFYTEDAIERTISGENPVLYPNTNWVDLMINKAAPITSHSVSVSGGNNVARFAVTGNYLYQEGMIPINSMNRFNIRANTSITLSKNFLVYLDMLAIKRNTLRPNRTAGNQGNRILEDVYRVPPTILPRYPSKGDGQEYYGSYVDIVNPLAYAEKGGYHKYESGQTTLNLQPKWTIFPNFNLKGQFSYRLNSDISRTFRDNTNFFDYNTGALLRTWGTQRTVSQARTTYYYLAATADYTVNLGDHFLFGMAGYSQEETNSGDWDIYSLLSGFAKLNYSYKNKYLVEATIRTDGSSRFAEGNKFGYFPSVAVGWNMHNEKFMQGINAVNNLKLRASYGKLGNENIGLYQYQTLISTSNGVESSYGNPDITWETVNMLDIGFDLGLFANNKLELTFDYYDKRTNGIILKPQLPYVGGFQGEVPVNAGKVSNKGIEVALNYNDQFGNVEFSFRPGVTYNQNEILSLVGGPYISGKTINEVGSSINSIFGYRTNGLLQESDFDELHNPLVPVLNNQLPGDIKYVDVTGDGFITDDDQMLIGNSTPNLNYFANFRIAYKGFDLEFLLQGTGSSDAILAGMFALPLDLSFDGGVPTTYYAQHYWTPERTGARFPRISTNPANNKLSSDFWFQDAAYLRVKYAQLGYIFNSNLLKRQGINSVRVYANAQNPLTITSLKLTDPESKGNQWTYSIMELYTVGININF